MCRSLRVLVWRGCAVGPASCEWYGERKPSDFASSRRSPLCVWPVSRVSCPIWRADRGDAMADAADAAVVRLNRLLNLVLETAEEALDSAVAVYPGPPGGISF